MRFHPARSAGMRRGWFLGSVLLLVTMSLPAAGRQALAQQFDQLRGEVRAPHEADPPDKRRKKRRREYCDDSDNGYCDDDDESFAEALLAPFAGAIGYAGVAALASPFWVPAGIVGDDYENAGYFPGYPYQDSVDGYLMKDPWIPVRPRAWSARLRGDYVDDFDAVASVAGHLLVDTSTRWGFDGEFRYRQEDLGLQLTDELWTGDANVLFRFAQSPRLQMRAGVGANWLSDTQGTDFGVNFTYGGDWFPVDPLIVSAELDVGWLGNATLVHGRVTTGVQWRRVELFTGYDFYDVGETHVSGLVAGLRLWF